MALIWFLLALIAGVSGFLALLSPPFPQLILFGLVIVLVLLFLASSVFRSLSLETDINVLLLIHLTRFVGIYFLILYSRGVLPYDFAVLGGWGDIITAFTSILVLLFSPTSGLIGFVIYFVWNLFGFIDILFVVTTAGRMAMAHPQSMMALTKLPLSLLPTFLVPIIIYSHIVVSIRLWRSKNNGYRTF